MTTSPVPPISDEQIAELEERAAKKVKGINSFFVNQDVIAALIARLRAAEKDAGRYRFIRDYDDGDSVERALINPNYTPMQIRMGAGLDSSIDTAMSEAKP